MSDIHDGGVALGMKDQCAGLFESPKTAAVRVSQNVLKGASSVGASVLKVARRLDHTKGLLVGKVRRIATFKYYNGPVQMLSSE
jgi:hypothetical protein